MCLHWFHMWDSGITSNKILFFEQKVRGKTYCQIFSLQEHFLQIATSSSKSLTFHVSPNIVLFYEVLQFYSVASTFLSIVHNLNETG